MNRIDELHNLSEECLYSLIISIGIMVRHKRYKRVLWGIVVDAFCVGSGSASDLCRKAKLDPDQYVSRNWTPKKIP